MTVGTVLLVDDEEDIRAIGEMALSSVGGYEVICAVDGTDAVSKVAAHTPDVILLDVMMPGMDGPETLAALRASDAGATVPIIFMTAKVQRHEIEQYLALGAVGVITKPFDPMKLSDQVADLLQ